MDELIPKSTRPQTDLLVHNIYLICENIFEHVCLSVVKFEIIQRFKIKFYWETISNSWRPMQWFNCDRDDSRGSN